MIKYKDILETAEILNREKIYKKGLTLEFLIPETHHRKLEEELFYKTQNKDDAELVYSDIIELTVDGINFKFIIEDNE